MTRRENLDLKMILSLTAAYEKLYEKGEISATQLDEVLSLIDQYQNFEPAEFARRLKEIFPDI